MATAILFKNADLYAPEHKGIKQILTVNEKSLLWRMKSLPTFPVWK